MRGGALKERCAHAAALSLLRQHGKYDGSICELTSTVMDNRPYTTANKGSSADSKLRIIVSDLLTDFF